MMRCRDNLDTMPLADSAYTRHGGISDQRLWLYAAISAALHILLAIFIARSPMTKHEQMKSIETYLVAHPASTSAVAKQSAVSSPGSSESPHLQGVTSLPQTPVLPMPEVIPVKPRQPDASPVKEAVAVNSAQHTPETGTATKGGNSAPAAPIPAITGQHTGLASKTGPQSVPENISDMTLGESGAPQFVHRELPAYPFLARKLGKEGKVVIRLTLDETGSQKNIEVVEQSGFGFTDAAVAALKKSIFTPARIHGKAIASRVLVPVRFVLNN